MHTRNVISQDEQKRLEYTAKQKALYDYNTLMEENHNRGLAERKFEKELELMKKWKAKGLTDKQIKELLN